MSDKSKFEQFIKTSDLVVKVIATLILGVGSYYLNKSHNENELQVRHLDLFYEDILSGDPWKRHFAMKALRTIDPALQVQLLDALEVFSPLEALHAAIYLADNRQLSSELRESAERRYRSLLSQFQIKDPDNDAVVSNSINVSVWTPFLKEQHKVVVSNENGEKYSVDIPIDVSSKGEFIFPISLRLKTSDQCVRYTITVEVQGVHRELFAATNSPKVSWSGSPPVSCKTNVADTERR